MPVPALRTALKTVLIVLSIPVTGLGIDAAARSGVLELAAVSFALGLVALYRLLGPRAEHSAWTVFLVCLGLTYVDPAGNALPRELGAFAVCTGLAVAGAFVSPWFIAAGFAAHVGWDFIPRELPAHLTGLPVACLLFDGIVAAYVGWQASSRRWTPLRRSRVPDAV